MKNKTRRKLLISLLSALVILLGAAALSSCKIGLDAFTEYQKKYDLSGKVVYYANGGTFGKYSTQEKAEFYFSKNAPMLNIVENGQKVSVNREDYTFAGWKIAEGGEKDGAPVIGENDPWVEFPKYIGEKENLVVYAVWEANVRLDCYLVSKGESFTLHDAEDEEYTTNAEEPFLSLTSFTVLNTEKTFFKDGVKDATFVGLYADPDCTVTFKNTATVQKPADGSNGKIYVRYLAGKDWKVLKTASDVVDLFSDIRSDGAEGKKYLLYDSVSNVTLGSVASGTTFKGIIEGEGKKISNIKVGDKYTTYLVDPANDYSLFGRIGSDAVIRNLTLETVALQYTLLTTLPGESLAAIAYGVEEGATLTGFKVEGLSMKVSAPYGSVLSNFDTEEEGGKIKLKDKGMWIFGGNSATDAAVKKAFGVSVTPAESGITFSQTDQ